MMTTNTDQSSQAPTTTIATETTTMYPSRRAWVAHLRAGRIGLRQLRQDQAFAARIGGRVLATR